MSEIVSNQLYVTGYNCIKVLTSLDIKKIFQEFNDSLVDISYQGCYSIVTFNSAQAAQKAQQQINGMNYDNNILKVEIIDQYNEQGIQKIYICQYCGKQGHTAEICPHITQKNRDQSRSSGSRSSSRSSYSYEISVNPRRRRNKKQKDHKYKKQRNRSRRQNDDDRISREDSSSYHSRHKSPIKIHLTIHLKPKRK